MKDPTDIERAIARSRYESIRILAADRVGQDAMRGLDIIQRAVAEARQTGEEGRACS